MERKTKISKLTQKRIAENFESSDFKKEMRRWFEQELSILQKKEAKTRTREDIVRSLPVSKPDLNRFKKDSPKKRGSKKWFYLNFSRWNFCYKIFVRKKNEKKIFRRRGVSFSDFLKKGEQHS